MGFFDFFKKLFSDDEEDAELRAARERHGIKVEDGKGKKAAPEHEPFDPWEEIKEMRSSMWVGRWATRKFRIVGEEKVKKELEELAKKREAEGKGKTGG